ncbi:flagellar protein FliT [Azoarcus olearius]|uniref:Flagellar protein FliT n=1 Tax=Azoarcus sp. (strain BH72) TaxID=418699 RepID=A1K919_AZOSB|nr:flagellar protein FliT [Azoarcus olearius]ANQ85871.1 flagellar-like protein FliT [Azoarcus olearius]CAL95324.1 hypothetical flagellar related protein FliT [Azoarcus olearius]
MLSLENSRRLLAIYQAMADAARANDWDRLGELGRQGDELRRQAAASQGTPAPGEEVDLAATIRRILELDGEIRTHAEPAYESTRKLLSGAVQHRNVRNAYGSLGG